MPRLRSRRIAPFLLTVALAWAAPPEILAAKPRAAAPTAPAGPLQDPDGISALQYRSIGPAWGGRVSRATGVVGDPRVYYAATAAGGVWKSEDGGATWKPIFDQQPISSIGSIAVAPSDPNVVYVGSGEANIRGNVAAGNGIYKSIDAGKTWTHVWVQEGQIGTMVVHPKNPDIAFAAVLGHAFGPNPERGVYRTKDGGRSWVQVLRKDSDTGASDVALDPSNPNIVFAGLWQARRRPWEMTSGGPGSGLYVSRDGGTTWTQRTGGGLPDGPWGKVGVAVAPSDGRRVYALIEAADGGLYRSDDGGESWSLASGDRRLRQRAWYYTTVTVGPANPDEVWIPNVPMLKSLDGGKTFGFVKGIPHGDNHDLWIDPKDPKRMIGADDGGVNLSANGGESWVAPALPIGQFYHVAVDTRVPFRVAGAMQDIGTAQAPSNTLSGGIRNGDWYSVGGGEAGWVVSDPVEPDIVYAGEYLGYLSRYDHRTRQTRVVGAWPDNPSGWGGEQMRYRFQWTAPIAVSPHPPHALYHGANVLFRSTDRGETWTAISPDLTRDDKSKQKWSGGPITGDNTGVETYCTIFAVAESPLEKGLIWAGSDDGLVHVTRDDGRSWQSVTANIPALPEWGTVSLIEPSRFAAGTAYLVVDAHRLDDMRPYLWKTADYGRTWTRLGVGSKGLPVDVYLHAVREDPVVPGMLYLATERGVALSRDDGRTWRSLKLNLPTVAVHDLAVTPDALVVGTNGRSLWILDDLAALRAFTPEVAQEAVRLLPPPPAVRWTWTGEARDRWSGDNPPAGALLTYWLEEEPKDDIAVEIFDAAGTVVRRLSSKAAEPAPVSEYVEEEKEHLARQALSKKAGLQRAVWDLAWDGAELIPGAILDSGYPGTGPLAVPGTYTVRLTVDGATSEAPLELRPDPRSKVSSADLAAQLRFTLEVRDGLTRLAREVVRLQAVRRQLADRNALLAEDGKAEELRKGSDELIAKLDAVEAKLHNPKARISYDVLAQPGGAALYSRLAPFFGWAKEGDGAPTQGQREVFAAQRAELDAATAELAALLERDLGDLNRSAEQLGIPRIYLPRLYLPEAEP
jgi:photosystem II stability/assembly factor-like uncharacterized protein